MRIIQNLIGQFISPFIYILNSLLANVLHLGTTTTIYY